MHHLSLHPCIVEYCENFQYTHKPLGKSIYKEKSGRKLVSYRWYITRKNCITSVLTHAFKSLLLPTITPLSGRGLVIPIFFSCSFFFEVTSPGHPVSLGQANINFVANVCYITWAHTLSDCNIFRTLRGGGTTMGSNAPGAFLVSVMLYMPRKH